MPRQLTDIERKRVHAVLEHELNYRQLLTPEEWHQLAEHWNWDDGLKPLVWIVQQPQCDLGTALLIYWHASPTWYYQFKDREDALANHADAATYDCIKEIEQRVLSGFYTRQEISFDPRNVECAGDDLTVPGDNRPSQQEIPEFLKRASPGVRVARQDLLIVTVRPLNEIELLEVASHLKQGYRELARFTPTLRATPEPIAIVEAIALAVETQRQASTNQVSAQPNEPILDLGWVWADQLRRAYGWQWRAWDYEVGAQVGIFSPDKQYGSFPPNLIRYTLSVKSTNKITALFRQLSHIERTQDLAEAYGYGWVTRNPYYQP